MLSAAHVRSAGTLGEPDHIPADRAGAVAVVRAVVPVGGICCGTRVGLALGVAPVHLPVRSKNEQQAQHRFDQAQELHLSPGRQRSDHRQGAA